MLNICVLNPINHSFRAKLDIKNKLLDFSKGFSWVEDQPQTGEL